MQSWKQMGFLAPIMPVRQERPVPGQSKRPVADPSQCLIRFDSGRAITFSDARQHTIVFGTTGSGKTACVMLPAIRNALQAGHGMIIGDIKGNMGNDVRKLAASCGREGDIVEYGCGPLAERRNLLAFMGDDSMRGFFESLADESSSGESRSWGRKGAQIAADCAILMRYMSQVDKRFWPTLSMVSDMLDNPFDAARLYTHFIENFYDNADVKQRKFVTSVDANKFHILIKLERKNGELKPFKSDRTYEEQITWNMQAIKMSLRAFLEAPGVATHFSAHGADGITLSEEVRKGKVILLRFDALTGKTGSFLTRMLLSECYRTVLKTTIEQRDGKLFFVILDEFQEYSDFSDNTGSDKNFVALAREFGGCLLAGTQSMASLACRAGNSLPVESFIGNCNNVLSFYGNDLPTQELMGRHDRKLRLNRLKPGQLFAATYDSVTRKHFHGIETLDHAFRQTADLLSSMGLLPSEVSDEKVEPTLFVIGEALERKLESRRKEKEIAERVKMEERDRIRRDLERVLPNAGTHQNTVPDRCYSQREVQCFDNINCRRTDMDQKKEDEFIIGLKSEFSEFFADDFRAGYVPLGWRSYTLGAFRMLRATGFTIKIDRLDVYGRRLMARDKADGASLDVLNRMLYLTVDLCMICGGKISQDEGHEDDEKIPVCPVCRRKYVTPASLDMDIPF